MNITLRLYSSESLSNNNIENTSSSLADLSPNSIFGAVSGAVVQEVAPSDVQSQKS